MFHFRQRNRPWRGRAWPVGESSWFSPPLHLLGELVDQHESLYPPSLLSPVALQKWPQGLGVLGAELHYLTAHLVGSLPILSREIFQCACVFGGRSRQFHGADGRRGVT